VLNRFSVPLLKPEDIIPHLAKTDLHWKKGFSAQELAYSWFDAKDGFPDEVAKVLKSCSDCTSISLVDACFEKEVELRTPGRNSQTDLMVLASWNNELGIIAVEGKVDEPFGELVSDWNDGSEGKEKRLSGLCATLGLNKDQVGGLRYQLLHRSASAVYEAQRYRARRAIMLVHSFSSSKKWFDDFVRFSVAMGINVRSPDTVSSSKLCEHVSLRLAWVSDKARLMSE
jgi:uncharacterized protein YjbJ (UPF0337 family)